MKRQDSKGKGAVRRAIFAWGEWCDGFIYSILRDGWKVPRVLMIV